MTSLLTPNMRWVEASPDGFVGGRVAPITHLEGPEANRMLKDNVDSASLYGYLVNHERSATLIKADLVTQKMVDDHFYPKSPAYLGALYHRVDYQRLWLEPLKSLSPKAVEKELADMVRRIRSTIPKRLKLHVAVVYNQAFWDGYKVNPDPLHAWTAEQKAEARKKYPFIFWR